MVNAIILAGGFGTRLRPLSCTIPKPMFPVLNKPLLNFIITRMVNEVPDMNRIVIAVNYRANDIKAYMDEWQKSLDVEIVIQEEKRPLGTGGAVGFSRALLEDDSFFMLNGDVISFFSYQDMFKKHKDHGGLATISAIHVDDVSRYGVIVADEQDLIHEFYEKPRTPELLERYGIRPINAGTYLLEPGVFDHIPAGKRLSIEKDVFPKLVAKNLAYKYEFKGLWRDLGQPEDYLTGNFEILDLEARTSQQPSIIHPTAIIGEGSRVVHPVCIAEGTTIGKDCEIGPHAIVGKESEIGDGVFMKECVLFEHCFVDNYASVEHAILGDGVKLGRWARVHGPAVIGSNVFVEDKMALTGTQKNPVKVCPWRTINKESLESVLANGLTFL